MSDALLATQMALAREQKLTDLGGVVAAAAHELGTPLATIKLVSSELADDARGNPAMLEDIRLIGAQADRCRDILRSMGRAGKDDIHLHRVPLEGVLRDAAEPHTERGKVVRFTIAPETDNPGRQPVILRRPEIIHGMRNLIQNAVDFSLTSVVVESSWSADEITVRIMDDGRGFPASIIGRIGDPFVRRRKADDDEAARPGYEGMGLGLFIAKTLLERSGASLTFLNGGTRAMGGSEEGGAIITVTWDRNAIDPGGAKSLGPLGPNKRFEI
jgi:two-component system sensor histidine kinase RegB